MKYLKTNEEFNLRRTMGMAAIAAMPFMTSCDKHDNSLDVKPQTQTTHVQPTQINSVDSVKYKFGFKATSDTSLIYKCLFLSCSKCN